jgi:hypothetical protein
MNDILQRNCHAKIWAKRKAVEHQSNGEPLNRVPLPRAAPRYCGTARFAAPTGLPAPIRPPVPGTRQEDGRGAVAPAVSLDLCAPGCGGDA